MIDLLWAAVLDQKSNNTKRAYRADFKTFRKIIGAESEVAAFEQLLSSGEAAESLMIRIRNGDMAQSCGSGMAPRSINRMLATLRLLLRAAYQHRIIPGRIYNVQSLRVCYGLPGTTASVNEIVKVIDCAKSEETPVGRRIYACLWLSLDIILTLEAIRALNIGDLDIENMRIRISDGHAHAFRWCELATITVSALARWLEVRNRWGNELLSPLFVAVPPSYTNKRLSVSQLGIEMSKAFSRSGMIGGHRTLIGVSRRETVFSEPVMRLIATGNMGLSTSNRLATAQAVAMERQFGSLMANARALRFSPCNTHGV